LKIIHHIIRPTVVLLFRCVLLAGILLGVALPVNAQLNNTKLKTQLTEYFRTYNNPTIYNPLKYDLVSVISSDSNRTVDVYANDVFGMQPFTPTLVEDIYNKVRNRFTSPYNDYALTIYAGTKDIRDLITSAWTGEMREDRTWRQTEYRGLSWVENTSLPEGLRGGLQGRHLSLWASHGKYYSNGEHKWMWQRPHLFCTTEDLLTQSIAIPFLYPMLERAGAIVFTPRERDWQKHEIVVDNDFPTQNGTFTYSNGHHDWELFLPGFSNKHIQLTDFDDPHREGTSLFVASQSNKRQTTTATWKLAIPEDGNYAVYVTYPVIPNAIPDALYTICHNGVETNVRVNQQMGGSTWVYLGTFDFKAGTPESNYITLSNHSNYKGYVGADAVRVGGGMSNIVRADIQRNIVDVGLDQNPVMKEILPGSIMRPDGMIFPPKSGNVELTDSLFFKNDSVVRILQYNYTNDLIGSGLPRHLEAARYTTQWMGLNRERFSVKDGIYDYGDDINARPIATNYLSRGSVYMPGDSGLCVPIELNLALHSDAGYNRGSNEYIGSLAIHTSDYDQGLYPGGLSRMAGRELCDILLQQVETDLRQTYGNWQRRQIYDRNYGETRVPKIPSAILEMFSHQNFADMRRALDPNFKFTLARSIYKGILRFVTLQHNTEGKVLNPTVAPLPVHCFMAQADIINHHIRLSWQPTIDKLEPTAIPTSYIVYTKKQGNGWDNGILVNNNTYDFVPGDSQLYQFKVEAVNEGGRSMPSETLCARLSDTPNIKSILIVNGFQRLASPQPICSKDSCGFDMNKDPGVPFIHTSEYAGRQLNFKWSGLGKEGVNGMGYCGTELEGVLVKGNTFDYPTLHAEDLLLSGDFNISSASREAIEEKQILVGAYDLVDLILGAQREDGYSTYNYKTFTPVMQNILQEYTQKGGSLLVSGAYIGTDMASNEDQLFTDKVLHYKSSLPVRSSLQCIQIDGMGVNASYQMQPNESHLSTSYISSLTPDSRAFATMIYKEGRQCAAVAYKGADYACISLGFPIEQICESDVRQKLMSAFLEFLLNK